MLYSRLSTTKTNKIIRCFCEDIPATGTVRLIGVNRNTVNSYYQMIRK